MLDFGLTSWVEYHSFNGYAESTLIIWDMNYYDPIKKPVLFGLFGLVMEKPIYVI